MSDKNEPKASQTVSMPVEMVDLFRKMLDRLDRYESGDPADMQLERMRANRTPPGWDKPVIKGCLDPDTNVSFDAILTGRKDNLVFDMLNVRMPAGAEKWVKFGGLVPDGIQVFNAPQSELPKLNEDGTSEAIRFAAAEGTYTQAYKEWRYSALLQPTRNRVIGKVLPEYMRPKPKAA